MEHKEKQFAIVTENLSKMFGSLHAVSSVNLRVKQGEVYALIGPNGGGKTTLVKLLVGLLSPTKGSAFLFGHDIATNPEEAKKTFGYVSDDPTAYEYLTGGEFLLLTGNLRKIRGNKLRERMRDLSLLFPIQDVLKQRISTYSRGNRQKVAFLAALLPEPLLLIIDEPIVGLDPASIEIFGESLTSFVKGGGTVFFATHTLSFAEKYATRAGVMLHGRMVKETLITSSISLQDVYQSVTQAP